MKIQQKLIFAIAAIIFAAQRPAVGFIDWLAAFLQIKRGTMIKFRRHLSTHSNPNSSETFQELLVSKSARRDDADFMCLTAHGDF